MNATTTTTTTTTTLLPHLFEQPLTDEAVTTLIASDIPTMTDAQIAALLTEIFLAGPNAINDAIAPIARVELTRRNFINHVESIALAAYA